jgi:beta-phosphoglucomutase-like phosphatase (HAD superfamily)
MSKVLLFDCDGVLADTEPHGHRAAFNRMWLEAGVPWQWTMEEYGRKLNIAGGKERMASLFDEPAFRAVWMPPEDPAERWNLLVQWHSRKNGIYRQIVDSGLIPPRSGVKRLAREALEAGWKLGVASTSAPESVNAVLRSVVGESIAARFSLLLAGDVVAAKKPSPEIYRLAAQRLGIAPADCVVIEDSSNGLAAAAGAGMKCVITVSSYTNGEDFCRADLVLTSLGDPGGERCEVLGGKSAVRPGAWVTARDLEKLLLPCPGTPGNIRVSRG